MNPTEARSIKHGALMSFLAWIVLGLIAGFIAAKIVNKRGEGFFLDTILGIVGAVAGGGIFTAFGGARLFSILEAAVGAVVVLAVYHALRRRA
jgi:uncharacterized membrane protein YeaQ/YmgE (transglycosylase-associated protein family)